MCDQVDRQTDRQTTIIEPNPLLSFIHSFLTRVSTEESLTIIHPAIHSQYNIDPSYHHHGIHIHIHIHHGAHHHQDEKARRGRQGLL